MKAILYARVSTEDQTCEPQFLELRAFAQQKGWKVVGEFSDVMSGTVDNRPGMVRAMQQCIMGGVDVLACVKIDRIARSVANFARVIESLERMKVALVCTSQGIDTTDSNPCGKLMQNILSAFAAFERDIISERTKAGLRAAAAQGRFGGRPSLHDLTPEREAAIAAWQVDGGSIRDLQRRLSNGTTLGMSATYRILEQYRELQKAKTHVAEIY